jgi:MoaA/NifB/PqqE/SkfB family radical SAM enzyme
MDTPDRELADSELIEALTQSVNLGVTNVILVGGEPLLRKNLLKIIRSVDKSRAIVSLFTNGEYLSLEKCRDLKESGLLGLFISVDSSEEGLHDTNRGRIKLFSKVKTGIQNAIDSGLVVALSSFLSHDNLKAGQFETLMEFGRESGVHEVTFFDAIHVGRLSQADRGTQLTLDDHKKIIDLTNLYREKKDYPAVSPQSILTSEVGSSFCYAANTQFYLSATGEMTPCDFSPLSIGRFPQKSLKQLWSDLTNSQFYNSRSKHCRMQDPEFRKQTIDRIPENSKLPFPIERLA